MCLNGRTPQGLRPAKPSGMGEMRNVISISPFQCRMWSEHERSEAHITEASCRSEIDSFGSHGQLIPVLGRPVRNGHQYKIELVYGARRLFVARHLNIPIEVEVRELSDQEAAVALDRENRQRKDVSPYERGQCYARWLRSLCFRSQDEIARALRISPSKVSRMLKLAMLPDVIVNAFVSPLEIREFWGVALHQAWQDKRRQRAMGDVAKAISQQIPRPGAEEVYGRLSVRPVSGCGKRSGTRDEIVKDPHGKPLFRVRYRARKVAFLMDADKLSASSLRRLKALISRTMQLERAEGAESDGIFLDAPLARAPLRSTVDGAGVR